MDQLIELGYRGAGDTLKREEFEARKKADREKYLHKEAAPKPLASMGKDLSSNPVLQALAAREELVWGGKLTCIIFVRDFNSKGQEISGYIDLAHRYVIVTLLIPMETCITCCVVAQSTG
jgi:hypothetical protein